MRAAAAGFRIDPRRSFQDLLLGAALAAAVALWARKLIDGYTGDVLGATEQMFEIGFLLGVAAVIR